MTIFREVARVARILLRTPRFTLPTLLILALGIGATAAVVGSWRTLVGGTLPYHDSGRIVRVWWIPRGHPEGILPASVPLFEAMASQLRSVEALAGYAPASRNLSGSEGELEQVHAGAVTPDFFRVFEVAPLLGTTTWAAEARQVVVLSEPFWRRRLHGDPGVVGQTLVLNGVGHSILGVLPARVGLMNDDVFVPLVPTQAQRESPGSRFMLVYARTRSGVSPAAFGTELNAVNQGLAQAFPKEYGEGLEICVQRYQDFLRADYQGLGRLLGLSAGVLLLIAAVNLASQFLVRSIGRANETAIRTALGAPPLTAVRAGLMEALILGTVGAVLGLVIAHVGLVLMRPLAERELLASQPMALDAPLVVMTFGLSIALCALQGCLPDLLLLRLRLPQALREGGRGNVGGGLGRLRFAFVSLQVGLALSLLATFGLLTRSLTHLQRVDLGFEPRNLAVFSLAQPVKNPADEARAGQRVRGLLERLRALPSVVSAGTVARLPVEEYGTNYTPALHGQKLPDEVTFELRTASPGLFEAMGIRRLEGRDFRDSDVSPQPAVAIVSRKLARRCWPGLDPLGQEIGDPDGRWCAVVGVVEDVHCAGPKRAYGLETVYFPDYLGFEGRAVFAVRFAPGQGMPLQTLRRIVREDFPDIPLGRLRPMEAVLSADLSNTRVLAQLLGFAAAVAFGLVLVGVYGALTHHIVIRNREFGVRMAVGAQPNQIVGLVLRESLLVGGGGIILGLGIAFASSQVLRQEIYGVHSLDLLNLLGSALALLGGVVVASLQPALLASRVEPAQVLRSD